MWMYDRSYEEYDSMDDYQRRSVLRKPLGKRMILEKGQAMNFTFIKNHQSQLIDSYETMGKRIQ